MSQLKPTAAWVTFARAPKTSRQFDVIAAIFAGAAFSGLLTMTTPVGAQTPAAAAASAGNELEAAGDAQTGVQGRVVDKRSGKPLEGAPVLVQGAGNNLRTTFTDARGAYRALLPPGAYTLRSYFDFYHGVRVSNVNVVKGRLLELNLLLPSIDEQRDVSIEEMEIPYRADTTTAAAQDQLRQASSGIGEGFGAKQMSQVGASDAGSAAAKVVGISVEDNQLVIRGLSGRYTRVLLNGITVPGVDPDVPAPDLDLFPSGVIDSLSVSKTFLPDLPADFAGGVMEIKSVSFPREFTLELGLTTGFDSQATFRERLDYRGGKSDNLGFDDGRRAIPDGVPTDKPLRSPFVLDQPRYEAARAFRNSWQYEHKTSMPRMGIEATVGDSKKFGNGKRFGYLVTASYDYDSKRKTGLSRSNPEVVTAEDLRERNNFRTEAGTDEVALSALGTASLDLGLDHSMTVLSLYNRSVSDETSRQVGNRDGNALEKWQLYYLARTLWFNQLFGDHRNLFGTRLRLRWAGFHAYGRRDEPDRRTVAYGDNGGVFEWIVRSGSGERFFSELNQTDVGGNLSLRFPLWAEGWATLGGVVQQASRDFSNRRFRLTKNQANTDPDIFKRSIEEILRADNIGRASDITEETRDNDSYESSQRQLSGYLLLETPLFGRLSFAGGLRAEALSQKVDSFSPFRREGEARPVGTDRSDLDYLPGGALKYQLTEKHVLRAAYGMTVARPLIRELASFAYYDFLRDRSVVGNPGLKRTLIQNMDLRWEWFFAEGQIIAASAFYKDFTNPIELAIVESIDGGAQFRNGESARSLGGEFEMRFNLGRFSQALRSFDFDGNIALVRSRIVLPANQADKVRGERPMYGQAPYVANLSLRFFKERKETGRSVTAALVYNVVGPRISEVATITQTGAGRVLPPDIEEQPFHSLDFVGSAAVSKSLKVKLKVRNLLWQRRQLQQGSFLIQETDPGIAASLGLSLSY